MTSISIEIYDAILRAAYEGVSNAGRWIDAMKAMQDLVGGCQATYLTTSRRSGSVTVEEIARTDESLRVSYMANFVDLDPIRDRLLFHGSPKGIWLNDEQYLGPRGRLRHPFYQELLRPHGLGAMLSVPLFDNGDVIAALTFQADARGGAFHTDHQALLDPLLKHLLIAAELRERLKSLSYHASVNEAVLAQIAMPLFIVSASGRQLYCNRQAERWQQQRPTPVFEAGGAAGKHALGHLIRKIAASLCGPRAPLAPAFEAAMVDHETATSMIGLPLTPGYAVPFGSEPVCLILVCAQPMHDQEFAADIIADLFGLTRAEHRLLGALSRSTNVVQAAALLGVGHATARTQIASVFQKTGCSTQVELARLIARISNIEPDTDQGPPVDGRPPR